MKTLFQIIILGFFVFFNPPSSYADVTVTVPNSSIQMQDELDSQVNISLSGQSNKNYYLEGAFKKEGSSNYFGFTFNDSEWVKYTASNFSTLKKITTDSSGNWNGSLKVKLDTGSSYFGGAGSYTFQVKRFTEGGSSSWSDNSIVISVLGSTPTPSASPAATSTPEVSPSPSADKSTQSFTITSSRSLITSDESTLIGVALNALQPNTQYFLKGAFFKDGSTNYFGKTNVNGSWIKNSSSYSSQYPITTDSQGNWSGSLTVMVDTSDSGYSRDGAYSFKVGRYNASGSSLTWSNVLAFSIKDIPVEVAPSEGSPDSPEPEPAQVVEETAQGSVLASTSQNLNKQPSNPNRFSLASFSFSATPSSNISSPKISEEKKSSFNWTYIGLGFMTLTAGGGSIVYLVKKR